MKTSAKALRRTGLLLAVIAAGAAAFGYTFILNDHTGLPIKWPAGAFTLRLMLGSTKNLSDGTSFNTSVQNAANAWNTVIGSTQINCLLMTSGEPADNNSASELGFASTVYGKAFGDGVLAVTTGYSYGNERVEADTLFNSAYTWDSYRGNLKPGGVLDLQRVAIHEIGHILGLDHPDEAKPAQSVNAIMNSRISNLDTLATDD